MTSKIFDFKEIDEFSQNLLNMAQKTMPRECRKFINKEGYKLRKNVRERSKQEVNEKSGRYHKGWRKGKVYRYKGNDGLAVRVYNSQPHAHVIEYGRRVKNKKGEYFKEGQHILEKTSKEFVNEFISDCDGFLDDIVDTL